MISICKKGGFVSDTHNFRPLSISVLSKVFGFLLRVRLSQIQRLKLISVQFPC